ncbi:MAG: hypothetical protein F6K42_25845 [Leptolyngbya sp. SIO1D8]|nr:hypothetical protein [Leptolyngbya sp. SIO1D8]
MPSIPPTPPRITPTALREHASEAIADSVWGDPDQRTSKGIAPQAVETGSSTVDALQSLGRSRLGSRVGILRSQFLFGILSRLPYPVIMVMPFLREDSKRFLRNWQRQKSQPTSLPEIAEDVPTPQLTKDIRLPDEPSPYARYRCPEHPLHCSQLHQVEKESETESHCQQCGFPGLLQENAEILGQQGRYQVGRFLGYRGLGRLYVGQDVIRQQPVVIREYLLPSQHFTPAEQRLTRDTFETIAGLKLADGREQDFRLMTPWDVLGDRNNLERCYLITQGGVDRLPTLRSVLIQQGALTPIQVREVLNQGLQTLASLHGQKYVLPAGQLQKGLTHGNLSLDSIVMLPDADSYYEKPQLLIFLRDLALWESLFRLPPEATQTPQPEDDLIALGRIGLSLLVGAWTDAYGRPLKPRNPQVWPGKDLPLEQFLRRLLTIEEPTFKSASAARRALLQLPPPQARPSTELTTVAAEESTRSRRLPRWVWLLLLAGLGLLGLGLLGRWWWSRRRSPANPHHCAVSIRFLRYHLVSLRMRLLVRVSGILSGTAKISWLATKRWSKS